jgi:hypothetical protein
MLQQTIDRVEVLASPERIFVSLSSRHRRAATAQLTDLPKRGSYFNRGIWTQGRYLLPLARVCQPMYRVIRVPQVGWSDWGTKERILTSLQEIGKPDERLQRLRPSAVENI